MRKQKRSCVGIKNLFDRSLFRFEEYLHKSNTTVIRTICEMCSSQKDSKEPQRSNGGTKAQLRGGILTKNYAQDPKQRKCLQRTQV